MSFESIDEALDIDSSIVRKPKEHDLVNVSDDDSLDSPSDVTPMSDKAKDYEYARAQLYSLIEKGQEAVNGALELAAEGDSARSYEVAINGIKNVSEVTEKLLDLQKKVKDLDEVSVTNNQTNVTNNSVFVGSTSELQKMIKEGMLNKLPEAWTMAKKEAKNCKKCKKSGDECQCPKKGKKGWYGLEDRDDDDLDQDMPLDSSDGGGSMGEETVKSPSIKELDGMTKEKKEKRLSDFKAQSDEAKKRREDKETKDKLALTRMKKGIRFYDAKGSGYMKGGKKVYD